MTRRLPELLPVGEHRLDHARYAAVAVVTLRPVEHGEHRGNRKRIDRGALRNQPWVVLVREFTDSVVIGERLRERYWQKMVGGILRDLCEDVDRLPDLPHQRGNLPRCQLLRSRRVVEEQLLDLDAEALEHDAPGQARAGTLWPETDLLAAQILEAANLLARKDMQLRDRKTDDVVDAAIEIGRLTLSTEILEHIRLGHCDVDPAQIEQVVHVRRCAIGDHRYDPELVPVIENLPELVRECHVAARQLPTGDTHRPVVLAVLDLSIRSGCFD